VRTIIIHFYNEELLLPWWLEHHLRLFDHGVLIDYASTDRSAKICRALAPHWRLVRSRNASFDATLVDFEVMCYEEELQGWKIALNVTEFLCVSGRRTLEAIEREIVKKGLIGARFPGACMVDVASQEPLLRKRPLIRQKRHGVMEADLDVTNNPTLQRSRFYHRGVVGKYVMGRHQTYWTDVGFVNKQVGSCRWFGYSPWTEEFLQRKLQIRTRLPAADLRGAARGSLSLQHLKSREDLDRQRAELLPFCRDLPLPTGRPPSGSLVSRSPPRPASRWSLTSQPVPASKVKFLKRLGSTKERINLALAWIFRPADTIELQGERRVAEELLRRLGQAPESRSIARWSLELGVDSASLLRIVRLLAERGWVRQDPLQARRPPLCNGHGGRTEGA
jgi:hypothetical protein